MRAMRGLKGEFSFVRGNALVLMASWVFIELAWPIPETYFSLFVLELGATPSILGLIRFASLIPLALVQFPGGYLADKYGRRRLIITMTFITGLTNILFALAPNWQFILIGSAIHGFCQIYLAALWAIMADSLPPERRGMGFSTMSITRAVSVASPLVAGFLCASYGLIQGMRIAYLSVMILYLLAAIVRMRLRETIEVHAENISFMEIIRSYPSAIKESVNVWRLIPRTMFYLIIISTATGFFGQMCYPYYVIYATQNLSIEKFQWSLLLMLQSAIAFSSLLPIGKIVDVFGRKKPLVIMHLINMLAMPLFIYGDFTRLIIFFTLSAIGSSMIVAQHSLGADLVPREHRGKVTGLSQFFGYLSASIGQLLGGFLYEKASPQLPFLLMLASTIPLAILTFLLIHEPSKRED